MCEARGVIGHVVVAIRDVACGGMNLEVAEAEEYLVEKRANRGGCTEYELIDPTHCRGVVNSGEDVVKQVHAGA